MSVLWITIGNSLRGDDALAARLVHSLAPGPPVTVRETVQLTPEIAAEFPGHSQVVFFDADVLAQTIEVCPVDESRTTTGILSHHCDPAAIVALARTLYDWHGKALICRIPATDFSVDSREHRLGTVSL